MMIKCHVGYVHCNWIGMILFNTNMFNLNMFFLDVFTDTFPANVNVSCMSCEIIIVTWSNGSSVVTLKYHRNMKLNVDAFKMLFNKQHLKYAYVHGNILVSVLNKVTDMQE